MKVEVREITYQDTFFLRQKILRPHQDIAEMKYPNDEREGSTHFGAYIEGDLQGIVSIYPEALNGDNDLKMWRLRGMAVDKNAQGLGVGQKLVEKTLEYCRSLKASEIWCNARTPAVGFYEKLGFEKQGEEFIIEGIGPHYVASIKL